MKKQKKKQPKEEANNAGKERVELDTMVAYDGRIFRGVQNVPSELAKTLKELDKNQKEGSK